MSIATDVANKEFEGAIANPDDLLHVQFYWHEPIDKWETEKIGKEVKMPKQPFVRIVVPGNKDSVIEVPVDDYHKRRFPMKWMAWQMREGLIDGVGDIPGWPLDEWPELNDAQKHELKYLRFSTVEQIAGASDAQVMRMGMGGLALREKAKIALKNRMGSEIKSELAAKDKQIQEMQEQIDNIKAMLAASQKPAATLAVETMALNQPAPKRKYAKRQAVSG